MKKAEERALEAYPQVWNEEEDCDVNYEGRCGFTEGDEQAEKDTIEKAAEWWYQHINGFLTEGLAKGIIDEFRNAMEDEK